MANLKNTTVAGTNGIVLPTGAVGSRPSPSVGMTRYNTSSNLIESYNGGGVGWIQGTQTASTLGTTSSNPAPNARAILKANPSAATGNYWIRGYNGTAMQVYCDMTGSTAGSNTGGWMRFDHSLVSSYRGTAINDLTNGYTHISNGRYDRSATDDGKLLGIRWDLGPYVNFVGVRITRFYFYSIGGPDGYSGADGPTPTGWSSATDTAVVNFYNTTYSLGSNYTSFGVSVGNGGTGWTNLARLYTGGGSNWTGEVYGGYVTLTSSNFIQYDHAGITGGRYVYFYESDSPSEYDSPYEYTIWLR